MTWGVGVASRGKLRGLSLPIANSQKASAVQAAANKPTPPPRIKTTTSPPKAQEPHLTIKTDHGFNSGFSQAPESMAGTYTSAGYQPSGPIPIPSPSSHPGWHVPGFNEHLEGYSQLSGKQSRLHMRPRPLQRLHTEGMGSYEESAFSAPSTGTMSNYSESDYPSPSEYPQTPEELSLSEPYINSMPDPYSFTHDSMPPIISSYPRSYPNAPTNEFVPSSIGSDQMSNYGCADVLNSPAEFPGPSSISEIFYFSDMNGMPNDMSHQFQQNPEADLFSPVLSPGRTKYGSVDASAIPRSIDPVSFHHLSPRLQFLLDYYDKAVCPVLVAFDGPANPYRMHVLHLAVRNRSVQNAIAALSTNNIRMRGLKELHRFGQDPFDHLTADDIRHMHNDPTPEELRYKSTSIALFNSTLNNRVAAADDANLATLLILCLYHVCDSGFNKFRTQLAGVQRLLQMRHRRGGATNFDSWVQMFFTWFDVMTATVNDREAQFRGEVLDMLDLSANLGAMEHLAGCDGRLYKLIARLGRLNTTPQTRPMRSATFPSSQMATPRPSPTPQQGGFGGPSNSLAGTPKDFYGRMDMNGWGSPMPQSPTPMSPVPGGLVGLGGLELQLGNPTSSPAGATGIPSPDPRHEFWTEWNHIRSRLTAWALDPPVSTGFNASGPDSNLPSEADPTALQHVSETFRHAAMLYTERLASPDLPASAMSIQAVVGAALRHLAAIPAASAVNKFLLWPILVIGTECVHAADRDIIRMRCVEMLREPGFFNNLSGLEVLERVWAEDDAGESLMFVKGVDSSQTPMLSALGGQAFRWRKAMVRTDGEYLVV